MGLINNLTDRLFGKASGKTTGGFGVGVGESTAPRITAATNLKGAAWDALDRVASTTSSFAAIAKNGEEVVDTPVIKLFNYPNDDESGDRFFYKVIENIYKGGKAYVMLIGSGKEPVSMEVVESYKVSELRDGNDELIEITINTSAYSGTYRKNEGRWVNNNPLLELVRLESQNGCSILDTVREEINLIKQGMSLNAALLENGGKLSTWINWSEGGLDEITARVDSIKNAITKKGYGSVIGTSGEATIKELGINPRDMDFASLQVLCTKTVYLQCGVPLPLVFNEASTMDNMKQAKEMFFSDTCIPLGNMIYGMIGRALSRREQKEYEILVDESKIPAVRNMLLDKVLRMKDTNAYTVNELRAQTGADDVDGGDVVLVPANQIALGDIGMTQ